MSRAEFNYGPDANEFKPQRWLRKSTAGGLSGGGAEGGEGGGREGASTGGSPVPSGPPDPMSFSVGEFLVGVGVGFGFVWPTTPGLPLSSPHTNQPATTTNPPGPRDCVGQALAMLELQVVLASLVARFTFQLTPSGDDHGAAPPSPNGGLGGIQPLQDMICYHITMFPRDGLSLVAAPRVAAAP
jgi:cytochrome P450